MEIEQDTIRKVLEYCWSATSKLESQIIRNPELPEGYSNNVKLSFSALNDLRAQFLNQD